MVPLALALLSLATVALPGPGMFVALGAGLAGVVIGLRGSRRGRGSARLLAAGGTAIATIGASLALARYVVTLVALDRLVMLAS
ncbi:MAG: hypothetical protein R3B06_19420 [Kofleriaceae bacterium]